MASLDQVVAPNAYVRATETANYVRQQLPESLQNPKVAIVCGSGLGGLADTIEAEPKIALDYANIPNFPQSTGQSPTSLHSVLYRKSWIQDAMAAMNGNLRKCRGNLQEHDADRVL